MVFKNKFRMNAFQVLVVVLFLAIPLKIQANIMLDISDPFPPSAPDIILTVPTTELLVGESVQLVVETLNEDGSRTDITSDPNTSYKLLDFENEIAGISSTGLVTTQKRGTFFVLASFSIISDSSNSELIELRVRLPGDTDDDGMTDAFEILHGLNPNDPADGELDNDGDALTNREEFEQGTDPNNIDSDGDTFADAVELSLKMDPNTPDERLRIPPSLILNDSCVVTALNRSVQVNPDGTFSFTSTAGR